MNITKIISNRINNYNEGHRKIYNILCCPTHESYQTCLSQTEHSFFLLKNNKEWDTSYRKLPDNYYLVDSVTDDIGIDIILSQDRFGQLQTFERMAKKTRIPLIHCEHTEPQKDRWSDEQFNKLKSLEADLFVYITHHNKKSWESEDGHVIYHGIDTELFRRKNNNRGKYVLSVVNYLKDRDYFCGYKEWLYVKEKVQKVYPELEFKLVGHNKDLGYGPAKNTDELVDFYNGALCYLNTSKVSPIPMSLLEAMSCECFVVSTANQEVPIILENLKNGISSNNLDFLSDMIINQYEKKITHNYGELARQTVLDKFNMERFCKEWNAVFDKAYNMRLSQLS